MARTLPGPTGYYFEELEVGDKATTAERTITETDIVNFMGLSGVFEQLHMSTEYIRKHSIFGKRVSPGPLTFIVAEGLAVQLGMIHHTGMALLGIDKVRYPKPTFCGDTIHVDIVVTGKRETSKPDRGVVTFQHTVYNQNGEVVMTMDKTRMLRRRPAQ
ncbi:MAG: MaoC family dehydratase N-terminal domain-containing protein [Burkholderiales bacterium]|nr:MaoC family dehydratase N-terminal domain-containing protein [Burkholderiales bacterium]